MENNKTNIFPRLSAQMAAILKKQQTLAVTIAPKKPSSFEEGRAIYEKERAFWNQGGPHIDKISNFTIPVPQGKINLRAYYPNTNQVNPAIIFFHGGGFIVGSLNTHDKIMRTFADRSDCTVIGVDYHLSPEIKYPDTVIECVIAINYLIEHAKTLAIDKENIALAGDSAGANLAIATALYLRDKQKNNRFIKSLLLYYGCFGLTDSASIRLFGGPWDGLTQAELRYYYSMYLRSPKEQNSPYFNILNSELSLDIPPVYLCAAELDPLRDDSLCLYEMLKNHNIYCKYTVYPGVLHTFLHYTELLDAADEAMNEGILFFKNQLK